MNVILKTTRRDTKRFLKLYYTGLLDGRFKRWLAPNILMLTTPHKPEYITILLTKNTHTESFILDADDA